MVEFQLSAFSYLVSKSCCWFFSRPPAPVQQVPRVSWLNETASAEDRCQLLQVASPSCCFNPGVRIDAFSFQSWCLVEACQLCSCDCFVRCRSLSFLHSSIASHLLSQSLVPSSLIRSYLSLLFQSMAFSPICFLHRLHLSCGFVDSYISVYLYEFTAMTFDFSNAPPTFLRAMSYLSRVICCTN